MLAVVHTVTSGQRLMDTVELLGPDPRIQVVFTAAPDVLGNGVSEFLGRQEGVVIPWQQAVRETFDLALAASHGSLHELHAPLVVLPHGASFNKLVTRRAGGGAIVARAVYGMDRQRLVRDGTVVASAFVLAHDADLARLVRECPEALPVAVVAGDPGYDGLIASLPDRRAYRRALAVPDNTTLVVATSTWGPRSLFADERLLPWLVAELSSADYRVCAQFHPNVWYTHGAWQVRAWLASCRRRGLRLVPPEADWRGVLAAADVIVGDHGSLAVYGAAAGIPVVMAATADDDVDPASAGGLLAATAPKLRRGRSVPAQLRDAARGYRAAQRDLVAARVTSQPGRFNANIRRVMYRLLHLPPPAAAPPPEPAPLPSVLD